MYHLPGVIAERVKAILGPSAEVVIELFGSQDRLVIPAEETKFYARGKKQGSGEYKAWTASQFSGFSSDDVLKAHLRRVKRIQVGDETFEGWKEFVGWLNQGTGEEAVHTYLIHFPSSLWEALRAESRKRKTPAKTIILDAIERHLKH